jgi:hypothetical protein
VKTWYQNRRYVQQMKLWPISQYAREVSSGN